MSNPINIDSDETPSPISSSPRSHNPLIDDVVDDDNEEINIHLNVKSIVTIRVKKSETIKDLKKICCREGVSENLLEVTHEGDRLADNLTFKDCGIEENSTVSLVLNTMSIHARRLFIRIPFHSQSNMVVVANVNDTINDVKNIIVTRARVNSEDFDLMFNGTFLDTHETVASLNLQNNTILYFIQHPREVTWISVYTPAGLIPLQIRPLQTIGYCKSLLGNMTNTNIDHAVLLFDGEPLDDSQTFASYNMPEHALLEMVYAFQVFVKLWNGKIITIFVLPIDDANAVNQKISAKVSVPVFGFPLFYLGERLEIGRTLESYGIQMNSIIRVGHPADYF